MPRFPGVIFATVLCLVCGGGQSAAVDLRAEARLRVPVTLNEPMISLRRLLARVEKQCGVSLEATPEIREETVCVCVREQPGAEVLGRVAQALEYRWTVVRDGSGAQVYRLGADPATRQARVALARRHRREVSVELNEQLGITDRFAARLGGLTPAELRHEFERLQARVLELPVGRERLRAEVEYAAAEDATDPQARPLLLALAALSPQARERLVDGERLVMAARRPGAIPMPDGVVQALRAARQAQIGAPDAAVPQTDDEVIDFLSEVVWGELTVYVRARRLPGQPRRLTFALPTFLQSPSLVAFRPETLDLQPGGVTADRPGDLQVPIKFTSPVKRFRTDQPLTYYTGFTVAEVLAQLAELEPRWQMSGAALLEGIQPGVAPAALAGGSAVRNERSAALLERLDAKGRAGALTLGELLEPLAERGGVNIRVSRAGWIRFHSTRPFRSRERQVDAEGLREVFGPAVEAAGLTPERAMAAGRLLSRRQMEALSAPYLGFPRHLTQNSGLRHVIDAWRLLDRLPRPQREALLAGAMVAYSGLGEAGRAAVRDYVRSISAYPNGAPLDVELGPRGLAGLRLALTPIDGSVRVLELRVGEGVPLYAVRLEAEWVQPVVPPRS